MRSGLAAVLLVALCSTTAACNDSDPSTGSAQTPAATPATTTPAPATTEASTNSPAPPDSDGTDSGGSSGLDSYCITAAGVLSLQSDLLIAVASGDPSAYQGEVDAIDPSAAPAEIADSIQTIRDLDEQYVADGQQASVSQEDLNDAMGPVADWVGAGCT